MAVDSGWIAEWMREFAGRVATSERELTDLDAAIGDGDHGTNMARGTTAVVAALAAAPADVVGALKLVGKTLVSSVGGASGPLYGTLFIRMGGAATGADALDDAGFAVALRAGVDGLATRGRAELGDKTMVDALVPAANALAAAVARGAGLPEALAESAAAAAEGRDATIAMLARKGRASYLGERSVDHQDPGATSAATLIAAAAAVAHRR